MDKYLETGHKYIGRAIEKFESPLLLRPDKSVIPVSAKLDIKYLHHGDIKTTNSDVRITSFFGKRFINGGNKKHYGVDFGIWEGAVVVPMKSGVVSFHGHNDHVWGYYALIKHSDGSESIYCHLLPHDFLYRSLEGTRVTQQEPIGKVGKSGWNGLYVTKADGTKEKMRYRVHLHVGIRVIEEIDKPRKYKATVMPRIDPDNKQITHNYYDIYEIWRNNE